MNFGPILEEPTGFFHPYAIAPLEAIELPRLEALYREVVEGLEELTAYKRPVSYTGNPGT